MFAMKVTTKTKTGYPWYLETYTNIISDMSAIYDEVGEAEARYFQKNIDLGKYPSSFDASGRDTKFVDLASSTKRERMRKGYKTWPPLKRTGGMRNSIEYTGVTNTAAGDAIVVACKKLRRGGQGNLGAIHQYGTPTIPARPFMSITRRALDKLFEDALDKLMEFRAVRQYRNPLTGRFAKSGVQIWTIRGGSRSIGTIE